jgi:general secretion pathway protein G
MLLTYQRIKHQREGDGENGFTLIELLVVIVVLGVLAAVVIFALTGVTGSSAVSACEADGNTVSTALAAFNTQNEGTGQLASQELMVTGTTANDFNPYLQSWPANSPHYAFALTQDGYIAFQSPATDGWVTTVNNEPASALPGTLADGELYTSTSMCSQVS